MKRRGLYWVAAALWGLPGIMIAVKGLRAYVALWGGVGSVGDVGDVDGQLWWHLAITAFVLAGFYFMFRRIVDKYCRRIAALPQNLDSQPQENRDGHREECGGHFSLFQAFPVRGWVLIVCMMSLGIGLKFLPAIVGLMGGSAPAAANFMQHFTASFYCGLGPMLIYAALRFIASARD